MSFFASVNGLQVVGGSLMIPMVGTWSADLDLATPTPVSGPATVVIGNLTLVGTIYRAEVYGGQAKARIVGGGGGWRKTIQAQGYGVGSSLAHFIGDAALACGEIAGPVPPIAAPAFGRMSGPASDVLWQCVAQSLIPTWRVDTSGVTQVTPWPTTAIATPLTVTSQSPAEGRIEVGTEDYASWLPGATFTAPQLDSTFTIAAVTHAFDNEGQHRIEVLTGTTDRLLGPLRAFVASCTEGARFYGRYAYLVTAGTTATVDCLPIDPLKGLPSLRMVPLVGDSIASYLPLPGSRCHVMFLDGEATQPVCVWTSGPPGTVAIGQAPAPLATAVSTVSAIGVLAGALAALGTLLVTPPTSVTFPLFATPAGAALNAVAAALAPFTALIPTKTVTAGP